MRAIEIDRRLQLLLIASALLGILVVVLAREVGALRGYRAEVQRMKSLPHAGQYVPTIRAANLRGDSITVRETANGRAQVLIAFSTTCPYCLQAMKDWKRLSDSLSADPRRRFDVVWISASSWDSTRTYVERHGIRAAVVRMPTPKLARVYAIKAVPLTVVLDRMGRVEHMHFSVFKNPSQLDSVFVAANRAAALDSLLAAATLTKVSSVERGSPQAKENDR